MKALLLLSMLLVSGLAHADVLMKCADSDGALYTVSKDAASQIAILEMRSGDRLVATQAGRLQGTSQLMAAFVSLSDERGNFLLVGTDANESGAQLTGTVQMVNRPSKTIRCDLQ